MNSVAIVIAEERMHCLSYITMDRSRADTREEAIQIVEGLFEELIVRADYDAEGNGIAVGPISGDYGIIGGAWSGALHYGTIPNFQRIQFPSGFEHDYRLRGPLTPEEITRLNDFWRALGGEFDHPHIRSMYLYDRAYPDDAALLTTAIYAIHLAHLEHRGVQAEEAWMPARWYDLDGTIFSREALIDRKWIVLVDIHC